MAHRTKKSKSGTSTVPSEADFQADSDMRTLIESEKIKQDKGRMSAAMEKGREQRDALSQVVDEEKGT